MTDSLPATQPRSAPAEASSRPLVVVVALLALSTIALIIIGNGNPLFAVVPLGGFLFLLMLVKMPLRWPALAMVFCGITLENPGDVPAEGRWKSPLYPLGALLMAQLKQTIPIGALVITGVDVLLILLTALLIHRRVVGSKIDAVGWFPTPRPMVLAAWVCLSGAIFIWGFGLATGGSFRFSLWQVQRMIYLPLVFLFLQAAIPGAGLNQTAGRMLLTSAAIKAAMAIYVVHILPDVSYATTHTDSMLFAAAMCVLVLLMFEKPSRSSLLRFVFLVPLLVTGMIANNRRLVWVELSLGLVFVMALSRLTPIKRSILRVILFILPIMPIYLGAGWNHATGVFAPVRTIRSVVDSKSDGSTQWRDLENYNLFWTIKGHPVLGTGLGHPYDTPIVLPDVSSVYELEPYCPHNSVLGLWAYTGYFGFSAIWSIMGVAVYFTGRVIRAATDPDDRVAALGCMAVFVIYMFHCYGDLGLGTWMSVFLVSFAMVMVAKMCTRLGVWPGGTPAPVAQRATTRAIRPEASRFSGG